MKIFSTLLGLLPNILAAVVNVENTVQASGSTKKAIVLSSIDAAAKVGEVVPNPMVAGISALVDQVVGVLNSSGIFTHSGSTSTSPATSGGTMVPDQAPAA